LLRVTTGKSRLKDGTPRTEQLWQDSSGQDLVVIATR